MVVSTFRLARSTRVVSAWAALNWHASAAAARRVFRQVMYCVIRISLFNLKPGGPGGTNNKQQLTKLLDSGLRSPGHRCALDLWTRLAFADHGPHDDRRQQVEHGQHDEQRAVAD